MATQPTCSVLPDRRQRGTTPPHFTRLAKQCKSRGDNGRETPLRSFLFRTTAFVAAALACLAGSVGRTAACAYHSGGKAFAAHPGAIDVAMAIQAAADAGTIEPQSASVPPASMVAYHRMVRQIEQFRNMLEAAGKRRNAAPVFSLLLVESALWSRFEPEPAGIELAIHTAGPDSDEPVVLTTGGVLRALLEGRLSAADALHRGLIRVEAATEAKLALFDLLSAAAKSERAPERR
jgi:hypothetical protein